MAKTDKLLKAADGLARSAESWADLANALFDPLTGLVSRALPTEEEREAFAKTEDYKKIKELVAQAQDQFGLVAGASPKKGISMLVRLPLSLHAALEREASAEGVGLDQLVVTKLAINLHNFVGVK